MMPRYIANVGVGAAFEVVADRGDLAAGEGDVRHAVSLLRRIDDAPAAQDQIISHSRRSPPT